MQGGGEKELGAKIIFIVFKVKEEIEVEEEEKKEREKSLFFVTKINKC